jgi:hypothetical protein
LSKACDGLFDRSSDGVGIGGVGLNRDRLPPARSISLTIEDAASVPFVYVLAMFAPSKARRFAITAPIPLDPPVTTAILFANCGIESPLISVNQARSYGCPFDHSDRLFR